MGPSVQVYVVQVWPAGPGFRALVRSAQAEQARAFDDPQALLDHLRGGVPEPVVATGPAAPPQPP